jgi:hypothetical protein
MDLASKAIAALFTTVLALLAYESRRLIKEVQQVSHIQKQVSRRQEQSDVGMQHFIFSIFQLLARLHPNQAEVIAEEIQHFYLKRRAAAAATESESHA